jgi:short subunit dehydrogenase-like uncharacterized protein
MNRDFDLILLGATGFTGRLVAEVLHRRLATSPLRWALAGRNAQKLAAVRQGLGAGVELPIELVDASDPVAVAHLVRRTRLVITTVGPYQRLGGPLVRACAEAGTDYVDLCGEPTWMAEMVQQLQAPAQASGARIVFSCGFDSIPFDLGVVYLQQQAMQRFGHALPRVRSRVRVMKGAASGGTVASLLATLEAIAQRPELARVMADPFALTPGFAGPPQPDPGAVAEHDPVAGGFTAPFVMAPINTKNVHRTNALRGHPWGRDFVYDERMLSDDSPAGQRRARRQALEARAQQALLSFGPSRALLRRLVLPAPGDGPTAAQREAGRYELLIVGSPPDGQAGKPALRVVVRGERDPGYGSTSRLITEAALCLLEDVDHEHTAGGVWTPGAAMGLALVRRLQAHAGLQFTVDDSRQPSPRASS